MSAGGCSLGAGYGVKDTYCGEICGLVASGFGIESLVIPVSKVTVGSTARCLVA